MKFSPKISLTKAGFSDIEFLWYLRNRPDVYRYSRQNRAISWKEHIQWITPVILGMSNKDIFIIENLETPIGQIRFDYPNQNEAEVSISILKEFRGKSFGRKAFEVAKRKIKNEKKLRKLIAEIHRENLSSVTFFEKLGFKFKTKKGNWLKYIFTL